ncbi:MAG: glycosyltransferase, partial [Thermoanaerobaculia bacterium]
LLAEHDIFCIPTRHAGEGHSSATNEAMMMGLVIVCTRHGFLESMLSEEGCYFVEKDNAESVALALEQIHLDREGAIVKAQRARRILVERYTDRQVIPEIERAYRQLLA